MDPIIPQSEQSQNLAMPELLPPHKHLLNKKFVITFVILILLGAGVYAGIWYWQKQQLAQEVAPTFTPRADETVNWKTYTNTQYGFEIKYPAEWKVNESIGSIDSTINIYKEGTPPLNHFSNETQVSIMPQGLATEGPLGESREANLDLTEAQEKSVRDFYLSNNKQTRGYYIDFSGIPTNWETYGYIWAGVKVANQTTEEIPSEGMPTVKLNGQMNADDFNLIKQILSTFKFTNNAEDVGILTGHVTIGPNCPVEQVGNPCTPAPQAYTSRSVSVYKADGSILIATKNFDTAGNYSFSLSAGTYVIKSRTNLSQTLSIVGTVTIKNNQPATLNFSIDTGIR